MIDVSSLTHLQAAILLLIDRRGAAGRRVCELVGEVSISKASVCRIYLARGQMGRFFFANFVSSLRTFRYNMPSSGKECP